MIIPFLSFIAGAIAMGIAWWWTERSPSYHLPVIDSTIPVPPPPVRCFKGQVNRYAIKKVVRINSVDGFYVSAENPLIRFSLEDAMRELIQDLAKIGVVSVKVSPPEILPGRHVYMVEASILAAPPDPEIE